MATYILIQLVQLGLEAFSAANVSRTGGPLIYPFKTKGISIKWQELLPVFLASALWHPTFPANVFNSGVITRAFLLSLTQVIPKPLVHFLVLISTKHNFLVRAHHVPRVNNEIADALSRLQVQRFRDLAPGANQTPCTIPPSFMTL